jgi:hypothetical protein
LFDLIFLDTPIPVLIVKNRKIIECNGFENYREMTPFKKL